MSSMNVRESSGSEHLINSLANHVTEFRYDPEEHITFAAWYKRFEGLFEKDAARLPDDAKVRMLLHEEDADVRIRLLSRMEENEDITLSQLTELCEKLTNLKHDTTLIA
uniref:DUF7083 domain-containing protein n=1 Tax=Anopheles stephensi TaxID=30069 RepID=A0A182YSK2_ANOST